MIPCPVCGQIVVERGRCRCGALQFNGVCLFFGPRDPGDRYDSGSVLVTAKSHRFHVRTSDWVHEWVDLEDDDRLPAFENARRLAIAAQVMSS